LVEGARRIELTKHLKFHGVSASRSLDASAAAIRAPRKGPITLWVAGEVDMYECVFSGSSTHRMLIQDYQSCQLSSFHYSSVTQSQRCFTIVNDFVHGS
jgi:hypothetical protein